MLLNALTVTTQERRALREFLDSRGPCTTRDVLTALLDQIDAGRNAVVDLPGAPLPEIVVTFDDDDGTRSMILTCPACKVTNSFEEVERFVRCNELEVDGEWLTGECRSANDYTDGADVLGYRCVPCQTMLSLPDREETRIAWI